MFARISHKGLNQTRQANKLHGMIVDGYHNKFHKEHKEDKPDKPSQSDKEDFIDALIEEESATLLGGLKYA